jgi:hypothetical protein
MARAGSQSKTRIRLNSTKVKRAIKRFSGAVSKEQALEIIGAASVLARDYLAWLSWGFDDNWKPRSD